MSSHSSSVVTPLIWTFISSSFTIHHDMVIVLTEGGEEQSVVFQGEVVMRPMVYPLLFTHA